MKSQRELAFCFGVEALRRRTLCNLLAMLLLDDDDELPEQPDEQEKELAERLGSSGLAAIDATLLACTGKVQHKVARIIARALDAGGFPPADNYIAVHARRLIDIANGGAVVIFGNPRRPRWSEVVRSDEPHR